MRRRTTPPASRPLLDGVAATFGRRANCSGFPAPVPSRGFTLVEVVIALAIVALVATLGVPAFGDWIASYRLGNHARQLAETMTRARTEAVRRGQRVSLCQSSDLHRCAASGGWAGGYLVYVDADRDGQVGEDETLLASEGSAPSGITVQANRPLDSYVSFTSAGHARMLNGALQMGTLVVCRSGQRARHVVLSAGGRIRVEAVAERCP